MKAAREAKLAKVARQQALEKESAGDAMVQQRFHVPSNAVLAEMSVVHPHISPMTGIIQCASEAYSALVALKNDDRFGNDREITDIMSYILLNKSKVTSATSEAALLNTDPNTLQTVKSRSSMLSIFSSWFQEAMMKTAHARKQEAVEAAGGRFQILLAVKKRLYDETPSKCRIKARDPVSGAVGAWRAEWSASQTMLRVRIRPRRYCIAANLVI